MKISDYLPELYNNNIEMNNIINSEEDELENGLKLKIDNAFKNTFIKTANEDGINKYEKLLDIVPNAATESLSFRRERVMSRLTSSIPYTEKYLINKLNDILGVGNWEYTLDYNTYTLTITTLVPGKDWYNELLYFFDTTVPCNIVLVLNLFGATWQVVKDRMNTWQNIYDSNMTWQELMDGEWLEQ